MQNFSVKIIIQSSLIKLKHSKLNQICKLKFLKMKFLPIIFIVAAIFVAGKISLESGKNLRLTDSK